MSIKDSTLKKINIVYIILSLILAILLIYGAINTGVSLKYESEKEIIELHTDLASNYIRQTLKISYEFLSYVLFNIIYLLLLGHVRAQKT